MNLISNTDLIIEEGRNRRDFDQALLEELATSIQQHGLLHLPVCTKRDGKIHLVAGERRARAILLLHTNDLTVRYMGQVVPAGQIPYALLEELDVLQAKEVELDENIRRTDLSWQERSIAVAKLHELRQAQNPAGWSLSDTAGEVIAKGHYADATTVHDDILLAQSLDDPAVAGAKSKREGQKALVRKMEREFLGLVGARVGEVISFDAVLRQCDAATGLLSLPAESVDCFCMDPPYGVDADKFHIDDFGTSNVHTYLDSWASVKILLEAVFEESFRAAKPQAHLYMFCDLSHFYELAALGKSFGWAIWPKPFIWVKDQGAIPVANLGPSRRYETILFANKGKRPVTATYGDVLIYPLDSPRLHAAQKPAPLYVDLLKRSVSVGDRVVDPFCGSGTIFEAARELKLHATGFDLDAGCIQLSSERIKKDGKN